MFGSPFVFVREGKMMKLERRDRLSLEEKKQCEQHIHLLIPRLYAVILPLLLSKAVAAEQRIPPDKFHSLLKIL